MTTRKIYGAMLLASASLVSLSTASRAQTAAPAGEVETIVVTGSRIQLDGFEAPTPVTVVSTETLLQSAPTNLVKAIQDLPQFLNSAGTESGGKAGIGTGRGNFLNLRSLESQRTLIMLDSVRMPPTTYNGNVNSEIIPQILVDRVDVVTAGASAAYGSDAIAGVVNFVLDHDFVGVKGEVSAGDSTYGDAAKYRVGVAGGFPLGERGHLLVSAERYNAASIELGDRPEGQDVWVLAGKVPGGGPPGRDANPFVFVRNATIQGISFGGNVTAGPLAGTYFNAPGQFRTFDPGLPTGTAGYGIGGDGGQLQREQSVTEDVNTYQGLVRLDYDIGDSVNVHVTGLYSHSTTWIPFGYNYFDYNHTIYSGNPYLPAAIQARMTNENIPSIVVHKYLAEAPLSPGLDVNKHYTIIAGADGDITDKLSWTFNYAHGDTDQTGQEIDTPELRKLYAAADAVRDSSGQIVCRVSVTNPGLYPGCVPLNLMGVGAVSPAALAYTYGTSVYNTNTILDQISGSVQGEAFDLWAGPVGFAIGAEYRKQKLNLSSNSDPAVFRSIEGLRGVADGAPRFWLANRASAVASLNVKEAFGELNVPLLSDVSFAQSLDVNGAVRVTDYSTSGTVTTWKAGGTWQPVDDVRFRLTRSRDIRAPTLYDFGASAQSGRSTLADPHTNIQQPVITVGSGNPNLVPERSNTLTFGMVYTPSYLPAFSAAIDFYDIKINGAIQTLNVQNLVNQCEFSNGTDPICANITRPLPFSDRSPANFPTLVRSGPANSAFIKTRGFDFEASYRTDLWDGSMTARALLTYIDRYSTQASAAQPIVETAGAQNTHDIKAVLSVNYTKDAWGVFVQERILGPLAHGVAPLNVIAEPDIPTYFYTDLTLSYDVEQFGADVNLFLTVNNLFNRRPPLRPGSGAPRFQFPTAPGYDIVGRYFTVGTRFQF